LPRAKGLEKMLNEKHYSMIDLIEGRFVQPLFVLIESTPPPCDDDCLKQNNYRKDKPKAPLSKAAA
jgi:hypothetical protein